MHKQAKDSYSPSAIEEEILAFWEKNKVFETQEEKEKFIMVLPPPNITGKLHLGHALMIAIEDCIARYERLKGKQVLFLPGSDHAGIATQTVIEKMIEAEGSPTDLESKFAYAWKWKNNYENEIFNQLRAMGASCDFTKAKFTLDDDFSSLVSNTFVTLFNRGLIYRDYKLVNYSPKLKSVISDLEVDNKEIKGNTKLIMDNKKYSFGLIYYFDYPIVNTDLLYSYVCKNSMISTDLFKLCKKCGGSDDAVHFTVDTFLRVCTTRPETIHGDTALVMHPSDTRYTGYNAVNPLNGFIIPIIKDESVDVSFGTGVMKVTPAHDFTDYELSKKHNLKLINILNNNIIIPTNKLRYDERISVVLFLNNYNIKTENYDMTIPTCSRTGDIIEPMLMTQWFMNMDEAKEKALSLINEIDFFPDGTKKGLLRWINNTKEWCLSRQLWWGHQIPAYKLFINNKFIKWIVVSSLSDINIKDIINNTLSNDINNININFINDGKNINDNINDSNNIKNINNINDNIDNNINITKNNINNSNNIINSNNIVNDVIWLSDDIYLIRDKDVLDTWFSSALCPLVHMGYPNVPFTPTTLLETGNDILFFWVARMIFMSVLLTDKVPFNKVLLHGIIRDALGRKMSKSLGNVINPLFIIKGCTYDDLINALSKTLSPKEKDISINYQKKMFPNGIKECGADALRFTLLNYVNDNKDISLDIKRVEGYRRFCNKIYNMIKYYNNYYNRNNNHNIIIKEQLNHWLRNKLSKCIKNVTDNLEKYNFMDACISLYSFILYDLCDTALEISKEIPILTDDIIIDTLILLHPFMPFISEKMYHSITNSNNSILNKQWPKETILINNNINEVIEEIKLLRKEEIKNVEEKYYKLAKALLKKEIGILEEEGKGNLVKYN